MVDTAFDRLQVSGDEAGTPPEDRRFRPDVEGLRAVAIALVVLYHSNVPGVTGGYVGVDVFFVISGFVITGLLFRERSGTGGTSLVGFYARRCRRILPAATLVILIAVLFSYVFLGVVTGNNTADDGRWAAVFLSNFHFESIGTSYFGTLRGPSPLQNYWSLSVEEQFYIVYPTLFLVVVRAKTRTALRARLTVVLGVIIFAVVLVVHCPDVVSTGGGILLPFRTGMGVGTRCTHCSHQFAVETVANEPCCRLDVGGDGRHLVGSVRIYGSHRLPRITSGTAGSRGRPCDCGRHSSPSTGSRVPAWPPALWLVG